jgi:hypothetical protein
MSDAAWTVVKDFSALVNGGAFLIWLLEPSSNDRNRR